MRKRSRLPIFVLVASSCCMTYFIIWLCLTDTVQVWDENASRNISDYVKLLKPHIVPKNVCGLKKFLLVLVSSRPDAFESRSAIRDTWGQKHDNATFYFFLGETFHDNSLQVSGKHKNCNLQKIQQEATNFGDIIQDRFVDSYQNLTLKTAHMLQFFTTYCNNSTYLMKVDDDVFLNTQLLVSSLTQRKHHKNVLLGKARGILEPFRNPLSKWYMPYKWYPNETYPNFLCGPSYVMSLDIATKLNQCTNEVLLIPLEDVYFTGICAKHMHIDLENNDMFTCNQRRDRLCQLNNFFTLHYFSPQEIRKGYEVAESTCGEYVISRLIFFFGPP